MKTKEQINFVTNPHKFMLKDLEFLGMSGQNLHELQLYSKPKNTSPVAQLKTLLELRHLCPTSPDTLRCFPFRDGDPFVIEKAPHVFFAGCQASYGEELIFQHKNSQESAVKLISVPTFALARSIVLLDLESLQSYELKFGKKLETVR